MSTNEHDENTIPDTFDLMDWVTSGTIGRREVTIYNDVAAGKRLAQVQERLAELGYEDDPDPDGDRPLGGSQPTELTDLSAEADDLLARLQASKAVWTVRALTRDEVTTARVDAEKVVPPAKMPVPPGPGASDAVQAKFLERARAYQRAQQALDDEHSLQMIARAVVRVETPRGVVEGATVEQLRALRSMPHGEQWINALSGGVAAATEADVPVPGPTSPGRSTPTKG